MSTQQPVQVSERRGYQPDLLWYPQEHCAPPDEDRSFSGPPSLIAEVLSPSTRRFDLVCQRGDILLSPLLDGFELYVARVFGV